MKESDSQKFNWDICGHSEIVHFLQSAIINNNLAHAYIFSGPSQLGKELVAHKFIESLLCQKPNQARPCEICGSCRQMKNSLHPDFYLIKQELNEKTEKINKNILIDQIRSLKYKLQQGTLLNGYKIALITDAQLMNLNTANALLKVLEEPTTKTVLILLVDNIASLPQTITSRCQTLRFLPVPTNQIKSYLENRGVFDSSLFAKQSHGRPGVAVSLAENQDLFKELNNNVKDFFKVINADLGHRLDLINDVVDWDKDEAINMSKLDHLIQNWELVLRDIMLIKSDNESLVTHINYLADLKKQADNLPYLKIQDILNKINQVDTYTGHNINSKSALENLIINL